MQARGQLKFDSAQNQQPKPSESFSSEQLNSKGGMVGAFQYNSESATKVSPQKIKQTEQLKDTITKKDAISVIKPTLDNTSPLDQKAFAAEQTQPLAPSQTETVKKLDELVEKSERILLDIKTAVPFNPFPDEVIVDVQKVNIIYREFFFSKQVRTIVVPDIKAVIVETGPIWATLRIVSQNFPDTTMSLKYLNRNEAKKARMLIEGLAVAHRNQINLSLIEKTDELVEKLLALGRASYTVGY